MSVYKDHPYQENQKNKYIYIAINFPQNEINYCFILATSSSVIIAMLENVPGMKEVLSKDDPNGSNFDQTMTEPTSAFAVPSASNIAGTTPQPIAAETNTTAAQTNATEQDLRLTNGKTPDDIPDADNDSVFEAQIRAAAMAETDPDTKKNLWNEYRRYKGLPEQK